MAENVDNSLMLEILKEVRKDQLEMRKDQQEMREELLAMNKGQQELRTDLQEVRREQRDQRALLLLTVDTVRKLHHYTEKRFLEVEERLQAHRGDLN